MVNTYQYSQPLETKENKIFDWYFFFAIGVYLLDLLISSFRPGIVISAILVYGFLAEIFRGRFRALSKLDFLVLIYAFYCIISIVWLPSAEYRQFYFETISSSILPIILMYICKYVNRDKVYNIALFSIILCTLIGLVLFVWAPQFYCDYLYEMGFAARATVTHARQGFSSFLGRTAMGSYSVFGMAICYEKYIKEAKIKWTAALYYMFFICIITAQRSAWVGAFLILLFFYVKLFRDDRQVSHHIGHFLILLLGIVAVVYIVKNTTFTQTQVLDKLTRFNEAFTERSGTWTTALENNSILQTIFGRGFGTMGHRAMAISGSTVRDGNYIEIFGEVGILGGIIFVLSAVIIFVKSIFYHRDTGDVIEVLMIAILLFQAFGSNTFETQVIAPIFWVSAGMCEGSIDSYLEY